MKIVRRKKILALLCAMSVALTSISFPFSSKADEESTTYFADTEYANWDEVTFRDFGIQDDTYNEIQDADAITLGTYDGTLEGKVFNGNVTFSSATTLAWFNGIYLACEDYTNATTGTNDLYMSIDGTTYQLTTENTGTTLLLDTELNLKLSYDVVTNADESKYLKLGVWINDRLYNNEYIEIATYDSYLNGGISYQTPVEGSYLTLESVTTKTYFKDTDYADWEEITFRDFGIQDDTYNEIQDADAITLGTYDGTLEGKVFNGNVTFSSATTLSWIAGIYLACEDYTNAATGTNDLYMSVGGTKYQLTPKNTGTTALLDTELNLKLSYDVVTKADESKYLKLGVWINDRLYNNEYIEIATYDSYLNGGISYQTPVEGAYLTLESVTAEAAIDFADTQYKDWSQITFYDFEIEDGTYYTMGEQFSANGACAGGLAGKVFSGNVKFTSDYGYIIIGGVNDFWNGLYMHSEAGEFYLSIPGEDPVLDPDIAGVALVDNEFNLKLSYDVVEDDESSYLKLGVWINDKLYNNEYIEIRAWTDGDVNHTYTELLGTLLGVYIPAENASVTLRSKIYREYKETNERYNLADGPYLISGTGTILVNGQQSENGATLTEPGTYKIVSDNGAFVRNVELYDAGQASTVLTHEENVMPIAGFYGPTSGTYSSGETYNYVTEEMYDLFKEAGINLINYIPKTWSSMSNRKEILQNLAYAEEQGISFYVWEDRLINADLSAKSIAEHIASYSQYDSFKGIFIVDEPGTDSYYPEQEMKIDDCAALSKALNGYCNLNGYINLYPLSVPDGSDPDEYAAIYADYLDEYITKAEPKMLSYDRYVFTYPGMSSYFSNLSIARQKSLDNDIPFWAYIQAGNWRNRPWIIPSGAPTEEQFMWNVNTCLAYGAKGIQYYPLVEPYFEDYDYERYGLLDINGNTTKWYDYAMKINRHIASIDEVLLDAQSQDVLAIGTKAQAETGISTSSYGNLESVLLGNQAEGAVIGAFSYRGNDAFYVVNYDMTNPQTITLDFLGTHEYEYRMIQNAVTSYGAGNACTLTIPAGEAVLVVLNDDAKCSMNLQAEITDSIAMNYVATITDSNLTGIPTMTFTMNGGTSFTTVAGDAVDGLDNTYKFTYSGIKPQDMAKTITATLSVGDYTRVYPYSVLDYCVKLLEIEEAGTLVTGNGTAYTDKQLATLKELVVDLVEYGAQVQSYGVHSGQLGQIDDADLLTTILGNAVSDYATFDVTSDTELGTLEGVVDTKVTGTVSEENSSYKWTGATLVFKDTINIRGSFKLLNEASVDDLTMMVSVDDTQAKSYNFTAVSFGSEGELYVDFSGIYANEFSKKISITFYSNGIPVGNTLNYSVNTYIEAKRNITDTYLQKLLLAINGYGNAAVAYNLSTNK